MENWRFIEANSDYMVSDHGRILSFKGKSKLIISSSITAKGYEYVAIRQKGIYVGYSVHRLVATAFIPNPKRLPQVNHLDGNKLNNHVANLEWCDAYDNVMHAIRTGLRPSSPALSPVPCATTDEAGNILQAYPSMNALVKGEQMNPKQRNWLVLHLLHPERLKQSAMKKKPRAERSGSEECFLIAPEIPVLTVKADSIGEFEAGNLLGTGRSSNSVGESEAGNLLGTGRSSNSVGKSEAGNLLGTGRSSNSVGESEAGNLLGTGRSSNSIGKSEAGNVCVQSVSSPLVSSPLPLISLFVPAHHSMTQHYYRRLSPEESAIFGFNTYILPREREQRKEFLQWKTPSSSTVPPPVRDRTSPLPISTAGTVPVASGPSAIITSSASTAPSNRDETSPSTGRIVWAGTSVPSASATSADWTRKAAPPTHGQMHNALPSSDW